MFEPMNIRVILSGFFLFFTLPLLAADGKDFFSNIGKIYVVVAVILIIFIGIIAFLIRLERKTKQLEDYINEEGEM